MIDCGDIFTVAEQLQEKFKKCRKLEAADMDLLVDLIIAIRNCTNGALIQDNKFKEISFGLVIENAGVTDVADRINNDIGSFTIQDDEIPIFTGLVYKENATVASFNKYLVLNNGKGQYGTGGNILLTNNDLILIEEQYPSSYNPQEDDPNANVVDLGAFQTGDDLNDVLDVINAANPVYYIQAGTNWYFQYSIDSLRYLYGFKGTNGSYGLNNLQMDSDDLFLIFDESSGSFNNTAESLEETCLIGNTSKNNIYLVSVDEINPTMDGYYVTRGVVGTESVIKKEPDNFDPNQQFAFIGLEQKANGSQQGAMILTDPFGSYIKLTTKSTISPSGKYNIEYPSKSGTIVLDAPLDGDSYVRKNGEWEILPSLSFEGYSETGTRLDGNLYVRLGDYDNSNNGTRIEIDDSEGEFYIFTPSYSSVISDSEISLQTSGAFSVASNLVHFNSPLTLKDNTGINPFPRAATITPLTLSSDRNQSLANGDGIIEIYAGTYDASTDTPTLDNSALREGEYYIVSVGGTIDFGNGPVTLGVGDIVGCNDTEWFKKVNNNQSGDKSNLEPIETSDTGTVISLSTVGGNNCNFGTANTNTNFTIAASPVLNGWAQVLINTATEPSITGATQEGGVEWQSSTDMYMIVRNKGTEGVIYYYLPVSILTPNSYVTSNLTGEPTGSDQVLNIVSLTQAEYDAGTPVSTTLYIITD